MFRDLNDTTVCVFDPGKLMLQRVKFGFSRGLLGTSRTVTESCPFVSSFIRVIGFMIVVSIFLYIALSSGLDL